jgi:hypothetical protein
LGVLSPVALASLACTGGCLERRISVVSDPPGALVTIDDTEVGRTPLTTSFTYYGTFDVQVRKEGFETISSGKIAATPIYEYPPLDLLATAIPARFITTRTWNYTLTPAQTTLTREQESDLIARANELRARTSPSESK